MTKCTPEREVLRQRAGQLWGKKAYTFMSHVRITTQDILYFSWSSRPFLERALKLEFPVSFLSQGGWSHTHSPHPVFSIETYMIHMREVA